MLGLSQLFSSPEDRSATTPSLTVISKGMTFRGTSISGAGDLRIEGTVRSDISVEGRVYVASGAEVYGKVHAQSIMVAGYVEGTLRAGEKLILSPEAAVSATLRMRTLRIDEGAQFEGKVQPLEPESSESSLSLEDEEESRSIPSRLMTSSSDSSSHDHEEDSDGPSSSTLETASTSTEETPSRKDETESSVSSSVDDSSPSDPDSGSSDEEEEDESSYGFQW